MQGEGTELGRGGEVEEAYSGVGGGGQELGTARGTGGEFSGVHGSGVVVSEKESQSPKWKEGVSAERKRETTHCL